MTKERKARRRAHDARAGMTGQTRGGTRLAVCIYNDYKERPTHAVWAYMS